MFLLHVDIDKRAMKTQKVKCTFGAAMIEKQMLYMEKTDETPGAAASLINCDHSQASVLTSQISRILATCVLKANIGTHIQAEEKITKWSTIGIVFEFTRQIDVGVLPTLHASWWTCVDVDRSGVLWSASVRMLSARETSQIVGLLRRKHHTHARLTKYFFS